VSEARPFNPCLIYEGDESVPVLYVSARVRAGCNCARLCKPAQKALDKQVDTQVETLYDTLPPGEAYAVTLGFACLQGMEAESCRPQLKAVVVTPVPRIILESQITRE